MNRVFRYSATTAIFLSAVLTFYACDEEEQPKPVEIETHLVTFDSDGGSAVATQNVEHGKTATKPTDPTRSGYDFDGWFKDDKEWDFATIITTPVTLKAKWADPNPPKLDFSNENIRDDISSYLRAAFRHWSKQASSEEIEAVRNEKSSVYSKFLTDTGIEEYLTEKFSNDNELATRLFDGLKDPYTPEENESICQAILSVIDTYIHHIYNGEYQNFISINFSCYFPLRVEKVYNTVLEKYANANPSTIPSDFNNTLQNVLIEEVKSGLPMGNIYGLCQLSIWFNTITGEIVNVDYYNGIWGEVWTWKASPTDILIATTVYPYEIWTNLWETIKDDLNGAYTSQNMELNEWDGHYLDLHLSGYNPYKYKFSVYILVGNGWWIKPQWKRSFPVGLDIQYHIWTSTGGIDDTATAAAAMILPIDSDVNIDNYAETKAVAVNYKEIGR